MPRPIKSAATPRPPAVKLRHAPQQVRIIGGAWKRTPLPVTAVDGLRPTPDRVRETVFNWLGQTLDGLRCLDLFAGTGALGFEAASRGAARVVLVERHPRAAKQLRAIKDKLGATAVEIAEADAIRFAASLAPASFDVVFLDPPFDSSLLGDALKLAMPLVAPNGVVYVEASIPLEGAVEEEAGDNTNPATPTDPAGQSRAGASLELPKGWTVDRKGRAGLVHYHLLRREIDE